MDLIKAHMELRSVQFTDTDLTADGTKFTGYAAVFDIPTDIGDFTEEVRRGAFRKVLATAPNVPMYLDHKDNGMPVATTGGGTLRLKEDTRGLYVEADLDDDHYQSRALRSMIRRGDVRGMSFGFVVGAGNQRIEQRSGKPHRVLTGFTHLLDVSPTWNPAYAATTAEIVAEVRSAAGMLQAVAGIDDTQQVLAGEHQQLEDGAQVEEQVQTPAEQDERTGVAPDEELFSIEAAARQRELEALAAIGGINHHEGEAHA